MVAHGEFWHGVERLVSPVVGEMKEYLKSLDT